MFKSISICISILILLCISSISAQKADLPDETPSDFNIYLKVADEVINTFDNKFTPGFIPDTLITIDMALSNKQMDTIYRKMKEIDIFDYPENFTPPYKDNPEPSIERRISPSSTTILKIHAGGLDKNIRWKDTNWSQAKKAVKLRKFIWLVRETANNHQAYKDLEGRLEVIFNLLYNKYESNSK